MARNYARITTDAWANEGWRELNVHEQWMFFFLLTQPKLTLAGTLDVKVRSWAAVADGLTAEMIEELLDALEKHDFIALDRDTDELAIRTFVRHDDVLKNQNLGRGMWSAWSAVESRFLRDFLVDNFPDEAWEPRFRPACERQEPQSEPRLEPSSEPPQPQPTPTVHPSSAGNEDRFTPKFMRERAVMS